MKIYLNETDLFKLLKEKYPECDTFDVYVIDKQKGDNQLPPSCRTGLTIRFNKERIMIEPHNIITPTNNERIRKTD